MKVGGGKPNQCSCLWEGCVCFFQFFLLAWLDVQEMWNTLLYPPVIPAVIGLEPVSIILVR